MQNNPLIGIVTVLYNSEFVLEPFFRTLNNQNYKNIKLYVVDNNSPDNSLKVSYELSKTVNFPVSVIHNEVNAGIAVGNNIGIKAALADHCDYVLISNNDVEIPENTIEGLLQKHISLNADMSVPKIYLADGKKLYFGGGKTLRYRASFKHVGYNKLDSVKYSVEKRIDYAPTCFMLVSSSVFNDIGLMDENYFVYYDDTDFIYRSQKAGKKLFYIPSFTLIHKESVCTGKRSDFFYKSLFKNREYFLLKNVKYSKWFVFQDFFFLYFVRLPKMILHIDQWKIIKASMKEGILMYKKLREEK